MLDAAQSHDKNVAMSRVSVVASAAALFALAATWSGGALVVARAQSAALPAPPPGPIESRIVSAPERGYSPAGPARRAVPIPDAASATPPLATIIFASMSAYFDLPARFELDRLVKSLTRDTRLTLNAFAYAGDPADARKVALARALAVRSYLIDQGVKAPIEIGEYDVATGDAPNERVDIVASGR